MPHRPTIVCQSGNFLQDPLHPSKTLPLLKRLQFTYLESLICHRGGNKDYQFILTNLSKNHNQKLIFKRNITREMGKESVSATFYPEARA